MRSVWVYLVIRSDSVVDPESGSGRICIIWLDLDLDPNHEMGKWKWIRKGSG